MKSIISNNDYGKRKIRRDSALHFTDVYALLEKEEDALIDKWKEKTEEIQYAGSPYEYIVNGLSDF